MSQAVVSAAGAVANQPIAISSSPPLPSPRAFLHKPTAPRSPTCGTKENEGHDGEALSPNGPVRPRMPFKELVGNFGCPHGVPSPKRSAAGEAPTKRRRIELQDQKALAPVQRRATTNMPPPSKPAKQPKSPKKKVQTITALATAAYQQARDVSDVDSVSHPGARDRVLQQGGLTSNAAEPNASEGSKAKKPRKPRSKTPEAGTKSAKAKKPAKPKKVKGKEALPKQELYSPGKAMERLLQQDFLFGTSSQLAAPDSPILIRQVQTALGESEATLISSQVLRANQHKSYFKVPSAPHGTNLSIGQANKELWCSAARDLKGSVARSLTTLSKPKRPAVPAPVAARSTTAPDDREPNVSTSAAKPHETANDLAEITASILDTRDAAETVADSSGFIDIDAYPSSKAPAATYRVVDALAASTPKTGPASRPIGSTLPTASRMISDLVDLDEVPPSTQAAKRGGGKKPAARAKKPKQTTPPRQPTFQALEEISDDEKAAPPSPPRVRGRKSPSAIKTLTLSPTGSQVAEPVQTTCDNTALTVTASIKATDHQWPGVAKLLFPRITEAVQAAPRSTKLEDITWHEKILLYDPIILEDFTAWLNEQGLSIMVTRLKRKTTTKAKGTKKKDKTLDEDIVGETVTEVTSETEVAEEKLQCWMVQKWCEENSICCCFKDTFKGAARAKY